MDKDEQAIRELIETWIAATKAGDTQKVLTLMADDVLFMVPGQPPFGKETFAAMASSMKGVCFEGMSEIQEMQVVGEWAWVRNRLTVSITPPGRPAQIRSGYTLTILRKKPDGQWVVARDANLLA